MKAVAEKVRARPKEIFNRLGTELYRRAYDRGMSLSAWLEYQDPSNDWNDGTDAFERLLIAGGIRTRSVMGAGVFASEFDRFNRSEQARALVPEWISRQWRKVKFGQVNTRAILLSDEATVGSWERPYADAQSPRMGDRVEAAIPISEIVALTTPIQGDTYRSYYLKFDADQVRKVRVGESAEIPTAELTSTEHTVDLYKFGRAFEASYEVLRRQRVDKISMWIQLLAAQSEADKLEAVLDVLVNGDGNPDTAAEVHDLTTLDGDATAGTLTLKGWLNFKLQFENPYALTTILAQNGPLLELLLLDIGTANVPLFNVPSSVGFGSLQTIGQFTAGSVRYGNTSAAPSNQIVGFDNRLAIERIVEVGANIEEIDRYVKKQTQVLTMTEVEGYAVLDTEAAKILDISS